MPATMEKFPASRVSHSYTFRCFIYHQKSTGLYVAECIDLDIMVKAKKPNKALHDLEDAVKGYIEVAIATGAEAELIPRRSPILHRVFYNLIPLLSRFSPKMRSFACTPPMRLSAA